MGRKGSSCITNPHECSETFALMTLTAWHARRLVCSFAATARVLGDVCNPSPEAREEAGMKLRKNHARVLKDVCNPSTDKNIDGKPLTQLELVRVAPEDEELADEALHEIERRLLGEGHANPLTKESRNVWGKVATYLDGRIQATPDGPGRQIDMSAAAAAATRQGAAANTGGERA